MRLRAAVSFFLFLVIPTAIAADVVSIPVIATGERPAVKQSNVAIASNGSVGYAAWVEGEASLSIHGRRIAAGTAGEPITIADSATGVPAVAVTPDGWLVAWPVADGVQVRLVGNDGSLGAPGLIAGARSCSAVRMASSGSRVLLLSGFCGDITGVLLDGSGNPLRSAIALGAAGSFSPIGDVVPEGTGFLVFIGTEHFSGSVEHDSIAATRVDRDGNASPSFPVAEVDGAVDHLAAASAGSNIAVGWITRLTLFSTTVASGASTGGSVQKASDQQVDDIAMTSAEGATWVAFRVYGTADSLFRARLTDGLATVATPVAIRAWWPSIAVIGGQPVVAWTSVGGISSRVMGRSGDDAASAIAPNAPDRLAARTTTLSTNVAAAWQEDFGGVSRIAVGGLDASGHLLPGSGSIVSGDVDGARTPAIREGRDTILLAWYDADRQLIEGRRLSLSLQPVDAAPFDVAQSAGGPPAIAFDGTTWLVAYLRREDVGLPLSVAAVRVTSDGKVLDETPIPVSPFSFMAAGHVDAAWDGSSFRVVWDELAGTRSNFASSIGSARVLPDRSVIEQAQLVPDGVRSNVAGSPLITRGGATTLVVWIDGESIVGLLLPKPAESHPATSAARRRSVRLEQFVIAAQVGSVSAVSFDGSRFHVFWSRFDNTATSFETIVSPAAEISQVIPTLPPVLDGARLGNALALMTSDPEHAPGLFWVVH